MHLAALGFAVGTVADLAALAASTPWTLHDLDTVADAAVTSAEIMKDHRSSHTIMLAQLAEMLAKAGAKARAIDVLLKAGGVLDPPNDLAASGARAHVLGDLAKPGDERDAAALANVDAPVSVKVGLLGALGTGQAQAGDLSGALPQPPSKQLCDNVVSTLPHAAPPLGTQIPLRAASIRPFRLPMAAGYSTWGSSAKFRTKRYRNQMVRWDSFNFVQAAEVESDQGYPFRGLLFEDNAKGGHRFRSPLFVLGFFSHREANSSLLPIMGQPRAPCSSGAGTRDALGPGPARSHGHPTSGVNPTPVPKTSQRAQVLGHVAELPDHLGVAEFASGGISRPAGGHRADVAGLAGQRFDDLTAVAVVGDGVAESPTQVERGDGRSGKTGIWRPARVQETPLLKPKRNAAPSRTRKDGRRQLLIYLKPQIIRDLKHAAPVDEEERPSYVLAEEAILQWLEKNRKPK